MCTRTPSNVKLVTQVQIHLEGRAEAGPHHGQSCTTHPWSSHLGHQKCTSLSHRIETVLHFSWLIPVYIRTLMLSVWYSQNAVRVGRLPFQQFQFVTEMLQWFISTQLRSQPAHVRVKNRKCYPLVCSDVPVDIVTGCILRRILFNTSVFKYKAVGCSSFRKHKYPFFCCTVSVCEIL